MARGNNLKEIVSLSREGTTVILDEVRIQVRRDPPHVINLLFSFTPGTSTLRTRTILENQSRLQSMLKK